MGDVGGKAIEGMVGDGGEAVTSHDIEVDGVGGVVVLVFSMELPTMLFC